jgi:hypothetical protein
MPQGKRSFAHKVVFISLVLLSASAPAFAQAGWKTAKEKGFTFQYPSDWNYIDSGGDDYGGTPGYAKALSPPSENNFALVILLFPKFSVDLKSEKMTYGDFMKATLEGVMQTEEKETKIEETTALLKHGKVPAFMVMEEQDDDTIKAAMVCGDLVKGNGALLMIMMNLPSAEAETGKRYIDLAEQIMASFTFPN